MRITHTFKLENMPIQVLSNIQNGDSPRYATIYTDLDCDMIIEIPDEEVIKALEEEGVVYSSEDDLADLYYEYLEEYFEEYINEKYYHKAYKEYMEKYEENKY